MIDLTPGDLVRIHASFVKADELVDRRRAVYRAAVAISSSQNGADLGWEKLDNPAVRAHLCEVLAGVASYDPGKVRSLDTLIDPDHSHSVGGSMVRVASAAVARSALVGALRRIDDQMHRHEANSALTLLTAGDSSFAAAARQVVDGSRLLTSLAPELAADLLAHVAVFAIVARSSAVRLGSASVKEYPGLVLVPEPDSPLEIAEAIVHEGAHQKFFDLSITKSIFGSDAEVPKFRPPWAVAAAPKWPLAQTFAAFHAYCCLGAFATTLESSDSDLVPNSSSLLPVAAERAVQIADWLVQREGHLGRDGRALLAQLTGRDADEIEPLVGSVALERLGPFDRRILVACGDWTLIAQTARPAALYWVPSAELPESVLPLER
jgi:hypothetical protein